MLLPSNRKYLLAQTRFEDVVEKTPAQLFSSCERIFFPLMGHNGSITARVGAFVFWKKGDDEPDLIRMGVTFPDVAGVTRRDDGTILLTMIFHPTDFMNSSEMELVLKAGLAEMEARAGDEWLQ